jgi:hypothetical protein
LFSNGAEHVRPASVLLSEQCKPALCCGHCLIKKYHESKSKSNGRCREKDVPLKEQLAEALSKKDDGKIMELVNALIAQNPTSAPARSSKAGRCLYQQVQVAYLAVHSYQLLQFLH